MKLNKLLELSRKSDYLFNLSSKLAPDASIVLRRSTGVTSVYCMELLTDNQQIRQE